MSAATRTPRTGTLARSPRAVSHAAAAPAIASRASIAAPCPALPPGALTAGNATVAAAGRAAATATMTAARSRSPRRRERDQHGQAGRRRAQRAAGEREVAAQPEHGRERRRPGPPLRRGEHEPDPGQRAHGVPVGQRPGEPVRRRRQRREREHAGKQALRQAVERGADDPGQQHGLDQAAHGRRPQHGQPGGEEGEIEQQALEVVGGRAGDRRPGDRHADPRRQRREARQGDLAGPVARQGLRDGHRHHGERARRPARRPRVARRRSSRPWQRPGPPARRARERRARR